jgi:hypothetical protein
MAMDCGRDGRYVAVTGRQAARGASVRQGISKAAKHVWGAFRRLHVAVQIVVAVFVTMLVIGSIGSAVAPLPKKTARVAAAEPTTTTQKPRPPTTTSLTTTTIRADVRWYRAHGSDVAALDSAFAEIQRAASGGAVYDLALPCAHMGAAARTLRDDLPMPNADVNQHLDRATTLWAQAAQTCMRGSVNADPSLLAEFAQSEKAAASEMNAADDALQALAK